MAFAETAPLVASLDLKGNFAAQLRKNQGALSSFSGSMGRVGRGAGQLGAGLLRIGAIAGTVAVGGLVAAGKAAIDFQDAFAGVRKTVNEADLTAVGLSFDSLAKSFRGMATEIPIAASEFARIGEAAGALGVKAQDIEAFTKTVALLGVTTNLTTDEAAQDLGKIGTILNLTGNQFTAFADILVNLGNKGASTESEIIEITKRFAASGRQAGLSIPQILAYASAISSAGAEPEAAGSSLSRLFGNLITETARATDKGKAFAEVTGRAFKDFSNIVEKDTNGAMLEFLRSLNKLDKFGQQRALKAVGITNVRDRNAILLLAGTIDTNLIPAFENADKASGALGVEAAKRFDTIASKLKVLKNNFIEAGITIGEGFLPALGRAADKLTAFLKVDANKTALKAFGEDIGKALDGINWGAVLDGARTFYGVLKTIFDVVNTLPTEIKAAAAAFLVLNKASGGLIGAGAGNIVGGLAGAAITGAASRTPGIGRIFAQPVFVTNWPLGGLGGGVGGAAGKGASLLGVASKVFLIGAAIGAFAELKGIFDEQSGRNREQATNLTAKTTAFVRSATANQLRDAIRGIEATQRRLNSGLGPDALAFQLNIDGVRTAIEDQKGILEAQLEALRTGPHANVTQGPTVLGPSTGTFGKEILGPFDPAAIAAILERGKAAGFKPTTAAAVATNQRNLERLAAANVAATDKVRMAVGDTRSELSGIRMAVATTQKPPITNVKVEVNVTAAQVAKSITIQRRFGPSGGSRDMRGGPTEFDT